MMHDRMIWQRLWWKELRQLLPMVTLLPVLVVLLLGFHWLTRSEPRYGTLRSLAAVLCLGMPGLFACGAGALLVGYEKELGTLDWLRSLPIPAERIVRIKMLAASVCLILLWMLGFFIYWFVAAVEPADPAGALPAEWIWPTYSLFILLSGFALAWWARSALLALMLVVPLAILPSILAHLVDRWAWPESDNGGPRPQLALFFQILGIGLAWWCSERFGRRALGARPAAPTLLGGRFSADRDGRTGWRQVADAPAVNPFRALVWQFARQSKTVLFGTALMLAVAVVLFVTSVDAPRGGTQPAAFGLAFLATSWLGVAVFQSDGLGGRIRFLAERGLSPRMIWMTRQAVPVGLLATFVLVFLALSLTTAATDEAVLSETGLWIGFVALVATTCYLSSQWLGQVLPSPIISAVAAPIVAAMAISYGVFAVETLGTPLWLVPLLLPVPAAATLAMTSRWMDERLGFAYWGGHGGFLAAVCLLPLVPLLAAMAGQPAMPSQTARELERMARGSQDHQRVTIELVMNLEGTEHRPAETTEKRAAHWEQLFDSIDRQLVATNRPVGTSSQRALESLRSAAALARLSLDTTSTATTQTGPPVARGGGDDREEADDDADPAPAHEPRRQYRRAVDLLARITRRMRQSPRLIEQDTADLLEIWLLWELRRERAHEDLGDVLFETTAAMLADRQARRHARMRAVALSWHAFSADDHQPTSLGGYEIAGLQEDLGTVQGNWLRERRAGMAVADLWELARGGANAATQERLYRVAKFWEAPSLGRYGIGRLAPYLRADDLDRFLHPPLDRSRPSAASQWHAEWERLAAEQLATDNE